MQMGTLTRAEAAKAVDALETGLLAGTTLLTLDGEMPVEALTPGARVITRDAGMAVLRQIEVVETRLSPIHIRAGSLGHSRPDRDMRVAPGAELHIRDWRAKAIFGADSASVQALRLVDGAFLTSQPPRDVTCYRLRFDAQHILYADGVEVLSAPV